MSLVLRLHAKDLRQKQKQISWESRSVHVSCRSPLTIVCSVLPSSGARCFICLELKLKLWFGNLQKSLLKLCECCLSNPTLSVKTALILYVYTIKQNTLECLGTWSVSVTSLLTLIIYRRYFFVVVVFQQFKAAPKYFFVCYILEWNVFSLALLVVWNISFNSLLLHPIQSTLPKVLSALQF